MNDRRAPTRVLAQVEVEQQILDVDAALADETARYADIADAAAEAEADYKEATAVALVKLAGTVNPATGKQWTVELLAAKALIATGNLFRHHKLYDARLEATKQAIYSLRARLDALRTIASDIRAAGG